MKKGGKESLFTIQDGVLTNYIQCAQEAKATNVLTLLIDYKNKAFPDFDPMAEFEIEW